MEDSPLSIRLLGGFEVRIAGEPMRSVRARSVEWLLALLVLRHGRGHPQCGSMPRAWLAGTLWPESSEAQALYNLRRNLMELRQVLEAEAARLRSPSRAALGLDLTGADVDVVAFDAGIAAGDERSLRAAVALYRGPLLEGCVEEWVFTERASRAEACLQALETLADRAAERGDPAAALAYLGQAAALDPLRDSTQRRRMQALAASGDLPAALLAFREHRLRLHPELNVEPDPETTRLFQALRVGRGGNGARGGGGDGASTSTSTSTSTSRSTSRSMIAGASVRPLLPAPLPHPLTALIGREQEVREVVESVRGCRLVTLVGGGGVGKTRLAIQAGEELAADFAEGAAFIELAALTDPALLSATVATALGVREADADAGADVGLPGPEPLLPALSHWFALHPVLLVLDNCEHLIEAVAALVHALLAACPELRVLATSRQRLGLTGEVVWRVPSLSVPHEDVGGRVKGVGADEGGSAGPYTLHPTPYTLMQYASVRLFAERAAAARPGFRLKDREDAVAVARICRRLDGIPLALKLAAARVALLTLPQIATRLDDRFDLLTGGSRVVLPRQQTLQALIDWSYHLLSPAERVLLGRLSVFAGGWTLEAAEAVCSGVQAFGRSGVQARSDRSDPSDVSDPAEALPEGLNARTPERLNAGEVFDRLAGLEEKSLVLVEETAQGLRYRMRETVREYAREKLAASGELTAMRQRHRDWYLRLAQHADTVHYHQEQKWWAARLESEMDNLRAALGWCQEEAEGDPAGEGAGAGLRLALALWWLWHSRGCFMEGTHWLEGMLARGSQLPASVRAPALRCVGHVAWDQGDRERARAFLQAARQAYEQVLTRARREGNRSAIAATLVSLSSVMAQDEDLDAAWQCCLEARPLLEELSEPVGHASLLAEMAGIAQRRGDLRGAQALLEGRLAICRKLGDSDLLVHALGAMGNLERDQGDYARASALYHESLRLRWELGSLFALAQSLEDLAVLAGCEQHEGRAIRLLGAGEAFCETLGARPPVADRPEYERTVAEARAALGEVAFAAAWAEGRLMSIEQAIEYALEDELVRGS